MFHRHKSPQDLPIESPPGEDGAAVGEFPRTPSGDRAGPEYERRSANECLRRAGAYDRFLHFSDDPATKVVFIDSQVGASGKPCTAGRAQRLSSRLVPSARPRGKAAMTAALERAVLSERSVEWLPRQS